MKNYLKTFIAKSIDDDFPGNDPDVQENHDQPPVDENPVSDELARLRAELAETRALIQSQAAQGQSQAPSQPDYNPFQDESLSWDQQVQRHAELTEQRIMQQVLGSMQPVYSQLAQTAITTGLPPEAAQLAMQNLDQLPVDAQAQVAQNPMLAGLLRDAAYGQYMRQEQTKQQQSRVPSAANVAPNQGSNTAPNEQVQKLMRFFGMDRQTAEKALQGGTY